MNSLPVGLLHDADLMPEQSGQFLSYSAEQLPW